MEGWRRDGGWRGPCCLVGIRRVSSPPASEMLRWRSWEQGSLPPCVSALPTSSPGVVHVFARVCVRCSPPSPPGVRLPDCLCLPPPPFPASPPLHVCHQPHTLVSRLLGGAWPPPAAASLRLSVSLLCCCRVKPNPGICPQTVITAGSIARIWSIKPPFDQNHIRGGAFGVGALRLR